MVANLSPLAIQVGAVSLFIYFLVDFTMTTYSLLKLKGTMAKIENILDEAKDDFEEAIKNIRVNFLEKRVLKAYPTLISKKYPEGLKKIKTFIKEYVKIDK